VALLPIRLYPDPVLRARCERVEQHDEALERLIEDMVQTMHDAPGIGLAAPQVGVGRRVAVVDLTVGQSPGDVLVLVNPEITARDGLEIESEGCLSIPDFTEKVARAASVVVVACDRQGQRIELEAEGLMARAIQHELDHLDGVLFVDHLTGLKRERARRHLRRLAAPELEAPSIAGP
jgi:peptide deformylase